MKYCPHCGFRVAEYHNFESSFEPQKDEGFKLPGSSPDFERLVKIPASQSIIYAVSIGLLLGLLAYKTFGIIAIPTAILIVWVVAWSLISSLFNRIILASIFPHEVSSDIKEQEIVTIYDIKQSNGSSIKRGEIRADKKQIERWARIVSLDLQVGGREAVNLTHSRFTKEQKIFSQPAYKKFLEDIESLGIIKRKNPSARNSPYLLTSTGLSFIEQHNG